MSCCVSSKLLSTDSNIGTVLGNGSGGQIILIVLGITLYCKGESRAITTFTLLSTYSDTRGRSNFLIDLPLQSIDLNFITLGFFLSKLDFIKFNELICKRYWVSKKPLTWRQN